MCNKFKKFGLQKFNKNKNGCTENCELYHPRACFEAMKTKTCKRIDCKFFHITETKKDDNSSSSNVNNSNIGSNNQNNSNSSNNSNNSNSSNNSNNSNMSFDNRNVNGNFGNSNLFI